MFDSWCSFHCKDLSCCLLLLLFLLTYLFTHISYIIVLQVFGTCPEKHLSKWHKILCPGVSRACVYFITLCDGCKKLSHDFTWLAQVPFELLRSLRARAERRTDGPVRSSPPFLIDSRFKGNVVQQWSVRASAVVSTHGGAPEENQAEEEPSAVGQRYLGRLLTCASPFCLQEHYGPLLPEGLQQRPGTGVQPRASARQWRCQGECSPLSHPVCRKEWRNVTGVFYCFVRGPALWAQVRLKKGTNKLKLWGYFTLVLSTRCCP